MSKPSLKVLAKSIKSTLVKRSPEILTGIGIVGMTTTVILAVNATPKAIKLIEKKREELELSEEEKLKPVDIIKVAWKPYIPAVVIGVTSISCLVGASSVNARRNAALAAAYTLSDSALREYKEKVVETIGEKKEKEIVDAVAKEKIENDPVTNKEVIITEKGDTLCYDGLFGRYFKSDAMKIKKAENRVNESILVDAFNAGVSLNDFYSELGLPPTKLGNTLGWKIDNLLNIDFSSQIAGEDSLYDGTPCLVIDYINPPTYDYDQ